MSNNKPSKLLWVDLEMTGLDVEKEVIIEVAAIVTDLHLGVISEPYHAVVKQPQEYLDNMDAWNKDHHGRSGLLSLIPDGKDPKVVEKELKDYIDYYFNKEPAILSGNSISQDRKFIEKYMPEVGYLLHYRMLDVTAWKVLMENRFNVKHQKKDVHRATDDIMESIAELKLYVKKVKP